jgi:hypothetical protein
VAITINLQILNLQRGNFGGKISDPYGGKVQSLDKSENMMLPEAAVAMAVAEDFNYCKNTKLNRRGEPEKSRKSIDSNKFVNSVKHTGSSAQ